MPKSTFFKIPSEKQERITKAARHEFLNVPYSEVSINKIIKEADIPRGSFYQYFDGKEDLFDYILQYHKNAIFEVLEDELQKYNGDMFSCIENEIDKIMKSVENNERNSIQILLAEPRTFEIVWKAIMKDESCDEEARDRLLNKIDYSILNVEDKEELLLLVNILAIVVHNSICKIFMDTNKEHESENKRMFYAKIESLKKHYTKIRL